MRFENVTVMKRAILERLFLSEQIVAFWDVKPTKVTDHVQVEQNLDSRG